MAEGAGISLRHRNAGNDKEYDMSIGEMIMKRKNAKELLTDSFRELLDDKPVNKISIQAIADRSQCSVSTFYRCFRDKYDLMSWAYRASLYRILGPAEEFMDNRDRSVRKGLEACRRNEKRLKNLILNTEGQDSFVKIMIAGHTEYLTELIQVRSGMRADNKTTLCVRIYVSGISVILCEWILDNLRLTQEELAEQFVLALPEQIKEILQI